MNSTSSRSTIQWMNLIAVFATIFVNIIANALPLNGRLTYEISDFYPNLFTPPGYVFAIWLIIYILLIVFALYQFRSSERDKEYLQKIGPLYMIGALFNIAWIFTFHYSYGVPELFVLTEFLIVGLLVTLLLTYIRLGIGVKGTTRNEKLSVHLPVSVYLGWISLATIASTASVLNLLIPGIPLATQEFWTAAVIIVALLITLLMLFLRHDFAFGLVVIWAALGITTYRSAIPIIYFAGLGTVILVASTILILPFLKKSGFLDYYMVKSDE